MCLAIGTQRVTRNGLSASVLAWRAGGWRSVPFSSARMAALAGVSCVDATECLITGFSLTPPTTAILRLFDGRSLSTIPVTNANALGARISCATRSFCLLLGVAGPTPLSGGTPIADIWNGTVLSPVFTGHAGAPACRPSFCMLLGSSGGRATAYRYQAAPG
jgi:hypothetical protein